MAASDELQEQREGKDHGMRLWKFWDVWGVFGVDIT